MEKKFRITKKQVDNKRTKMAPRLKLSVVVECLCLLLGLVACQSGTGIFPNSTEQPSEVELKETEMTSESIKWKGGLYLDGNLRAAYWPISLEEDYHFENRGMKLSGPDVKEDDLGELMGIATNCEEEALNGCKVYHFAQCPNDDTICIADTFKGYQVYVCDWLDVGNEIGSRSDELFAAYGLPDTLRWMSIHLSNKKSSVPLFDVEDEEIAYTILEILSGNTNLGAEEADLRSKSLEWYDESEVYSYEVDGKTVFPEKPADDKDDGNYMLSIKIKTTRGFEIIVDYFPIMEGFYAGQGFYDLSPEKAEELYSILQIPDDLSL